MFGLLVFIIRSLFGFNKELFTGISSFFYKPYLVHQYQKEQKIVQFTNQQNLLKNQENILENTAQQYTFTENTGEKNQENIINENLKENNFKADDSNGNDNILETTDAASKLYEIYTTEIVSNSLIFKVKNEKTIDVDETNPKQFQKTSNFYSLNLIQSDCDKKKALFGRVAKNNERWEIKGEKANFSIRIVQKDIPINGFTFSFKEDLYCSPQSFSLLNERDEVLLGKSIIPHPVSNVTILFENYFAADELKLQLYQSKSKWLCMSEFYVLPFNYTTLII